MLNQEKLLCTRLSWSVFSQRPRFNDALLIGDWWAELVRTEIVWDAKFQLCCLLRAERVQDKYKRMISYELGRSINNWSRLGFDRRQSLCQDEVLVWDGSLLSSCTAGSWLRHQHVTRPSPHFLIWSAKALTATALSFVLWPEEYLISNLRKHSVVVIVVLIPKMETNICLNYAIRGIIWGTNHITWRRQAAQ